MLCNLLEGHRKQHSFSAALKMKKNTLFITIAVTDYSFMRSWMPVGNVADTTSIEIVRQMLQTMDNF